MSKFKNNLIDTNLFPSFIVSTDLRSLVSNDSIEADFSDIRNKDPGIFKTNIGGWHSELYNEIGDLDDYKFLQELYNLTTEFVDEFLDNNHTNLYVSRMSMWLLENECYAYNTMHNHGKTDLIGVYYSNVPDTCCGITLMRTDSFTHTALSGSNNSSEFATSFTPDIICGRLYIIPGHIYHHVRPYEGSGLRRSIVFNINCNPTYLRQSE